MSRATLRPTLLTLMLGYLTATAAPYAAARAADQVKNPSCYQFVETFDGRPIGGIACRSAAADAPNLLFLHGAPGDWKAWKRYLEDLPFADQFNIIALDRPGYGLSGRGDPEFSLPKQAELAHRAVVSQWGIGATYYAVGHSFGGPVAVQLALDYPQQVKGLLLLAASLDPDLEVTEWYQRVAAWRGIRWLIPAPIDVCNREIMALPPHLVAQRQRLGNITQPVIFIQGLKDGLVPPGNADYAQKYMTRAQLDIQRLPDQNHYLPWLEYDRVKAAVKQLIKP